MGGIRRQRPVMLILAAFGQRVESLRWARERAEQTWGPIALESEQFDFTQTGYYRRSMGEGLKKQFFAFQNLIDPGELAGIKSVTNQWELECAAVGQHEVERPLNLDPGYVTEAKLVLASTKDRDHRLYLAEGIFGEVTLHYQHRGWRANPWTYPDYGSSNYHGFLSQCRDYLRGRYQADGMPTI